jgi:hypothetical protein
LSNQLLFTYDTLPQYDSEIKFSVAPTQKIGSLIRAENTQKDGDILIKDSQCFIQNISKNPRRLRFSFEETEKFILFESFYARLMTFDTNEPLPYTVYIEASVQNITLPGKNWFVAHLYKDQETEIYPLNVRLVLWAVCKISSTQLKKKTQRDELVIFSSNEFFLVDEHSITLVETTKTKNSKKKPKRQAKSKKNAKKQKSK